jgi:hypothetical protein
MSVEAQSRPPEVFSARVAIILFLVGVFSFSAFMTLSTFAPDFLDGDDGQAHALSRSAVGYSGVVKLLKQTGTAVAVSRTVRGPDERRPLVVLTPEREVKLETIQTLGEESVLIVLPKWLAFPSTKHKGWVGEGMPIGNVLAREVLQELTPKAQVNQETGTSTASLTYDLKASLSPKTPRELRTGKVMALQTIVGEGLTPIATTKHGKIVLAQLKVSEAPYIYVLSDPDLLNNQGIADIANARAGIALLESLRHAEESVTFDVTLNGLERTRSIMRLALQPPLLAATLSFVIIAGMLAWRAAVRSGPAVRRGRAIALGKRTLADNSAALIRLAGRGHTMAPRYADMVRSVAAEEIRINRDASETTAAELDRISQSHNLNATYSQLAHEAAAAQTPAETLSIARKLHAWTGDIIRATR